MDIPHDKLGPVLAEAVKGMAILQARQEAMECVMRALIAEAPPAHPLFWQALRTARSDLEARTSRSRSAHMPDCDAAALGLLNELMSACAPPAGSGTTPLDPA